MERDGQTGETTIPDKYELSIALTAANGLVDAYCADHEVIPEQGFSPELLRLLEAERFLMDYQHELPLIVNARASAVIIEGLKRVVKESAYSYGSTQDRAAKMLKDIGESLPIVSVK
jgi:hypothetical protein